MSAGNRHKSMNQHSSEYQSN